MISKYLKALIESNNRIIIPDFGAFMIQDSPEGKQITFNDFLKFNDGLLVNQIIKTDKISKDEATSLIKEFVKAVEKDFSNNKPFALEGLGELTKDNHGNIKFEAKKTSATEKPKTLPTDVKPTIVLDEPTGKKAEPGKDTPPEQAKEVKKPVTPDAEEKKAEPPVSSKPEDKPKTETKKPEPTAKPAASAMPQSKPTSTATKPMTPSIQKSNSNTKNVIIIVAAAVIIIGGATWSFFKFDLGSKFGKKEPVIETVQVPQPVMDTIPEDTVVPEPVVVEETPVVNENVKKYYLIGGSFKVASNATNFNQKLINEGYESDIVIRNNGFHCVSYQTYYTWDEVLMAWKDMRNKDQQTWILIR